MPFRQILGRTAKLRSVQPTIIPYTHKKPRNCGAFYASFAFEGSGTSDTAVNCSRSTNSTIAIGALSPGR